MPDVYLTIYRGTCKVATGEHWRAAMCSAEITTTRRKGAYKTRSEILWASTDEGSFELYNKEPPLTFERVDFANSNTIEGTTYFAVRPSREFTFTHLRRRVDKRLWRALTRHEVERAVHDPNIRSLPHVPNGTSLVFFCETLPVNAGMLRLPLPGEMNMNGYCVCAQFTHRGTLRFWTDVSHRQFSTDWLAIVAEV